MRGRSFQILPERSTSAAALRGRSIILIADPQNSTTAADLLANTPLTLDFDPTAQDVVVRDRGAAHTTWAGKRGPDRRYTEVYGLISMLPGQGESATGPHRTLIFSGITSVGAHAPPTSSPNPTASTCSSATSPPKVCPPSPPPTRS